MKSNAELFEIIYETHGGPTPESREAKKELRNNWATLNNFTANRKDGKRYFFSPKTLARGGIQSHDYFENDISYFDHYEFFREIDKPFRAGAIVVHLYGPTNPAYSFARDVGLDVHVPPVSKASWYWPGRANIVCYTRPGRVISWFDTQSDTKWESE